MLLINDKKGWFGSFSEIGKRAAKMSILLSRDPLNPDKAKKKFYTNKSLVISAFESSENKNKPLFKKGEDTFDIFTIDEADKAKLEDLAKDGVKPKTAQQNKSKRNIFRVQSAIDYQRKRNYHYYDLHRKKKNKITAHENPPCTKYNPKYNSILKRSVSAPAWSTIKGRDDIFKVADHRDQSQIPDPLSPNKKKRKKDQSPSYRKHDNILDTMAGKAFIDMKKQTVREAKKSKFKKISRPVSSYESHSITLKKNNSAYYQNNNNISKNILNNINKSKRPLSSINPRLRRKNYSTNLRSNISVFSESRIKKYNKENFNKKIKNKYATNIGKNKTIDSEIKNSKSININIANNLNYYNNLENINNALESDSENEKNNEDISKDSYEIYKHVYTKEIKNKNRNNRNHESIKEIIKGPNFKQMISRETLDKLKDDKIPVVPYLLPNFSSVREREIMMVVYDRKKHKINRSKSASLTRIDNTFYYNPNDILTKINNYVSSHPPNFNMMTSRPDDEDPLPSYMKRIYTRNSCYDITQLSLKLNNYKNRGFAKMNSSFFPKKSFNKIINLNLLKSKKFLNNVIGNQNNLLRQFKGLGTALKFYNVNYEDIMRANFLERFDNVTYKSIKKEHSKQVIELVKKIREETGQ
jgi:hypothetical protein